jgi:hypothetical protein
MKKNAELLCYIVEYQQDALLRCVQFCFQQDRVSRVSIYEDRDEHEVEEGLPCCVLEHNRDFVLLDLRFRCSRDVVW